MDIPFPLPLPAALEQLESSRYGFCFVDLGITDKDLIDFSEIEIQKNLDHNQYGEFSELEGKIAIFFRELGPNPPDVAEKTAKRIQRIVADVMAASGRETAWIALRASIPNHKYDIPRWHIDPYYYPPLQQTPKSITNS